MALETLASTAICITTTNCEKFTIVDKADWETETGTPGYKPASEITQTKVEVEFDGVVTTLTTSGYVEEYDVEPKDISQSGDTLTDGVYKIKVTYTDASDDYISQMTTFITCVVDCAISKLTVEVASQECLACDDKTDLLFCLLAYKHTLCSVIACGNFAQAEKIFGWIDSLLVNFGCNNC